jgi:hypothetical protein
MVTESRPAFSKRMPITTFDAHYWYRRELAAICRQHGMSAAGTKAELQARVRTFVQSGRREVIGRRSAATLLRKRSNHKRLLGLRTRLIPDGFKFNAEARQYFARHYGEKTFHFTKQMAQALRSAELRGDVRMTVADLLRVYERAVIAKAKRKTLAPSAEEKTYQWNHFVREFHADRRTRQYSSPLQAAALLWRAIRDRPGPKHYQPGMLSEFAVQLARFRRADNASR